MFFDRGGTRVLDVITDRPRFITVASPGALSDSDWGGQHSTPVHKDYALLKVLSMLRLDGQRKRLVRPFAYQNPVAPLDFSGLGPADVIFVVGHGNERGLYAMGRNADKGMDRLVQIFTGDGNLKRLRKDSDKQTIILLLSCRAGLGFHQALANHLGKALGFGVTVGGAQGFTFGSIRTRYEARNEVLVRGIPWWMEYEASITKKEAEQQTRAHEGKDITIDGKKAEIDRFKTDKGELEKQLKEVAGKLTATEVNAALDELDRAPLRSTWLALLQAQYRLYSKARTASNLEFDMWWGLTSDGYLWTGTPRVTDQEAAALLTGDLVPVSADLSSTR
jgi:hypothetical protein